MNSLLAWIREEWRLMRLNTWDDGQYAGPRPCTLADPRCQQTMRKLAEVRARMAAVRKGLLDGAVVTSSAATDLRARFQAQLQDIQP